MAENSVELEIEPFRANISMQLKIDPFSRKNLP